MSTRVPPPTKKLSAKKLAAIEEATNTPEKIAAIIAQSSSMASKRSAETDLDEDAPVTKKARAQSVPQKSEFDTAVLKDMPREELLQLFLDLQRKYNALVVQRQQVTPPTTTSSTAAAATTSTEHPKIVADKAAKLATMMYNGIRTQMKWQ